MYKIKGLLEISHGEFITLKIGHSLIALAINEKPANFSGNVEIYAKYISLYDTDVSN